MCVQLTHIVWPNPVPLPSYEPATPVPFSLIEIPQTPRAAAGKQRVRQVLREILKQWLGEVPVIYETTTGPKIRPIHQSPAISASISYCENSAWLAVTLRPQIGIDAVSLKEFEGWQALSALYLPRQTQQKIEYSDTPFKAFAKGWAVFEASLKFHGLSLEENIVLPETNTSCCFFKDTVVAIAF